jgi:hypothetical protein
LFEDDFSTDTSAAWNILSRSALSNFGVSVDFAYDYSSNGIPVAPHTVDGSTFGLKLAVPRSQAVAGRTVLNVLPKAVALSGDYALSFDLYLYGAGANGGANYFLFGINHRGTNVNGQITSGDSSGSVDGVWFAMTADGGASAADGDYQAYDGTRRLSGSATGFQIPTDIDATTAADSYIGRIFPSPKWPRLAAPGNHWVHVAVKQYKGVVTVYFNGNLVLSRDRSAATADTAGTLMFGYLDIGTSTQNGDASGPFALVDNVVAGRILTVDTADNTSGPNDGRTSLVEALGQLKDGGEIRFNIPGSGTHYLVTPASGYPIITAHGVTIDGFSQPGATANDADILAANNAHPTIYLDSRSGGARIIAQDAAFAGSNDDPGYGNSEAGILTLLGSHNSTIRGLGFLGKRGLGIDGDPSIYAVALVRDANYNQVSGCWFGVDADGKTVAGGNAAVTSFTYTRMDAQGVVLEKITTRGNIIGTRGEGPVATSEFNVFAGWTIASELEGGGYKISGNFFNVLPDGVTDYNLSLLGLSEEAPIQIGKSGDNTTIGTDGDGQSDGQERNIFGGITPPGFFGPGTGYARTIEFYSSTAQNVVISGNYFGVAVDGKTAFTNSAPAVGGLDATATLQFGSNADGLGDALEGNRVLNNHPFATYFPTASPSETISVAPLFDGPAAGARISYVGNSLVNNGPIPTPLSSLTNGFYQGVLDDPTQPVPSISQLTSDRVQLSYPTGNTNYPIAAVDIYAADPEGLNSGVYLDQANYPDGYSQGVRWLARVIDNTARDFDPAPGFVTADLSALALPVGTQLTVAVTYMDATNVPTTGHWVTGPFSSPATVPAGIPGTNQITLAGPTLGTNGVVAAWTGGVSPYLVQFKRALNDPWMDLVTTTNRSVIIPTVAVSGFLRVSDQAVQTVQLFRATLTPQQEVQTPAVNSPNALGEGWLSLKSGTAVYLVEYSGLGSDAVQAHLHGPAAIGANASVLFHLFPSPNIPSGTRAGVFTGSQVLTPDQISAIQAGKTYFNVHTKTYSAGEIRGQLLP